MVEPFDKQLLRVKGKTRHIDRYDQFKKQNDGLAYYEDRADELHRAAVVVIENGEHVSGAFAMLAGLSIELLLKGILIGLSEKLKMTHNLPTLADAAGISITDDDRVILEALTEYVYWRAKYPSPKDEAGWLKARSIFDSQSQKKDFGPTHILEPNPRRSINLDSYLRLWEMFYEHFSKVKITVLDHYSFGSSKEM